MSDGHGGPWWRRWFQRRMRGQPQPAAGNASRNERDRFDKFTERARRVLNLSEKEAVRLNHTYIGPEHLLLGLTRAGDGVAVRVLVRLGVALESVRSNVEFIIGQSAYSAPGVMRLTLPAKRVIELAVDEARTMGHRYVGTEHLLLGLMREGAGIAAGVLQQHGLSLTRLRDETRRELAEPGQR
jgi:ATP-dependent Clp protease ATP-binding subunit ClpC